MNSIRERFFERGFLSLKILICFVDLVFLVSFLCIKLYGKYIQQSRNLWFWPEIFPIKSNYYRFVFLFVSFFYFFFFFKLLVSLYFFFSCTVYTHQHLNVIFFVVGCISFFHSFFLFVCMLFSFDLWCDQLIIYYQNKTLKIWPLAHKHIEKSL